MNYLLLFLLKFALTATMPTSDVGKPVVQPVVVLELFTSQGCSSCPPADKALQDITRQAARSGQAVYGLSFHVDYWNRLGWQDPFSTKAYTNRQRQYNHSLKTQTYTPQLIINGKQAVIGGQRNRIEQAIRAIQEQSTTAFVGVNGTVRQDANQVTVTYTLSSAGPYRVHVALVQKEARTPVKNGENGGRTLVNTNVVRQFRTLDGVNPTGRVSLPLPIDLPSSEMATLVYVQRTDTGQIVGAKML